MVPVADCGGPRAENRVAERRPAAHRRQAETRRVVAGGCGSAVQPATDQRSGERRFATWRRKSGCRTKWERRWRAPCRDAAQETEVRLVIGRDHDLGRRSHLLVGSPSFSSSAVPADQCQSFAAHKYLSSQQLALVFALDQVRTA